MFELTGTGIRWQKEVDDDLYDDDDEPHSTIAHHGIVAVLRREDYLITDTDLVINAGRSAYLQSWPDDQPDDALVRVDNLGAALYELVHAHGEDNLSHTFEQTGGLAPGRSTIHFTLADGQLDPDAADPFKDIDGGTLRTIYRFTNM